MKEKKGLLLLVAHQRQRTSFGEVQKGSGGFPMVGEGFGVVAVEAEQSRNGSVGVWVTDRGVVQLPVGFLMIARWCRGRCRSRCWERIEASCHGRGAHGVMTRKGMAYGVHVAVPLGGEAALMRLEGEDVVVLEGAHSGSGKNVEAAHGLLLGEWSRGTVRTVAIPAGRGKTWP
jgi:hypothetical protein